MRSVWSRRHHGTHPGAAVAQARRRWWLAGGVGLAVALVVVVLAALTETSHALAGAPSGA